MSVSVLLFLSVAVFFPIGFVSVSLFLSPCLFLSVFFFFSVSVPAVVSFFPVSVSSFSLLLFLNFGSLSPFVLQQQDNSIVDWGRGGLSSDGKEISNRAQSSVEAFLFFILICSGLFSSGSQCHQLYADPVCKVRVSDVMS